VEATDNAIIRAYDSASVEASGHASVEAFGRVRVKASGEANLLILSRWTGNVEFELHGNAICVDRRSGTPVFITAQNSAAGHGLQA
jgi:hypothetical protein